MYAAEKLVAEITISFVGVTLNIQTDVPNHISYIGNWLSILKDDKKAIFTATAHAQCAADWILSLHPGYAAAHRPEADTAVASPEAAL